MWSLKISIAALALTAAGGTVALAAASGGVTAALNVTPLRLEFGDGQQNSQLLLRNDSLQEVGIQVRIFAWTQDAAGDHFQQSADFTLSPSIMRIEPGLTQTIHVVSAAPRAIGRELAYRVVIDQLPQSVSSIEGAAQTRLRLTLPLFAQSDRSRPGEIRFAVASDHLTISNIGGRSVKLANVTLRQGATVIDVPSEIGLHYVLAGAALQFDLPAGLSCAGPPVTVSGSVDSKAFNAAAPQNCS